MVENENRSSSVMKRFDGQILCQSLPMKLKSCHDSMDPISSSSSPSSSCFLFSSLSTLCPTIDSSKIHFTYLLVLSDTSTSDSLSLLILPSLSQSFSSFSIEKFYSFENILQFDFSSSSLCLSSSLPLSFEDCQCLKSIHELITEHSLHHFYFYDPKNSKIQLPSDKKLSSSPSSNFYSPPLLYNAEEIPIKHHHYLRPKSISKKDEFSHQPIHLKGIILKIFHAFDGILWIEILGRTQLATKGDSFFVYTSKLLSHSDKNLIDFSTVTIGDSLVFYSVYPVYLWGRLHGFAMTSRSSFDIHSTNSQLFPSLLPRSTSIGRKTLESSLQHASKLLPLSKTDYSLLEKKCSMFLAWSAYVNRRVKQCVSSSSSFRYHSVDYGRIFSLVITSLENGSSLFNIPPVILSMEQEFLNPDMGPFYGIRAGQDGDYLCSLLPEVDAFSPFDLKLM
jgi:hypothetical protein